MTTRLASASTFFCLMAALSCQGGDSGSSTIPNQLILDSLVAFGELSRQPGTQSCLVDFEAGYSAASPPNFCLCEGGAAPGAPGIVAIRTIPLNPTILLTTGFTYLTCANADNAALFSGTVEGVLDSSTSSFDFPAFGECENLAGELVYSTESEGCSGQLTATCGGETVVCDLGPDCQSCF
ncbi:hypothetical protein MK280_09445 [Myxococcota bacterium]|nr:hypothetical protein [Myxococcota bacterium]